MSLRLCVTLGLCRRSPWVPGYPSARLWGDGELVYMEPPSLHWRAGLGPAACRSSRLLGVQLWGRGHHSQTFPFQQTRPGSSNTPHCLCPGKYCQPPPPNNLIRRPRPLPGYWGQERKKRAGEALWGWRGNTPDRDHGPRGGPRKYLVGVC